MLRYHQNQIMILGTLNAVFVVKMTPEDGEINFTCTVLYRVAKKKRTANVDQI